MREFAIWFQWKELIKTEYIKAFLFGGALCATAQLLIDLTKLTPARILTLYVVSGVIISAFGLYTPLVDTFGCGASVPLTGFGHCLKEGVREAVNEKGFIGIFSGALGATACGISAAIAFSLLFSFFFRGKPDKMSKNF